jgi:Ca2+-transporting ATPase
MIQTKHTGLNSEEVLASRIKHGMNDLEAKQENRFIKLTKEIALEPLFILLVFTAIIYFTLHEYNEGFIMLAAIVFVSGISVYQENKSQNAVEALKKLTNPYSKVLRNGELIKIPGIELVVNDVIVLEDGDIIPADAQVMEAHDFSVNESSLTGESLPVSKEASSLFNKLFQGTMVNTGSCVARVNTIGKNTKFGQIGQSLSEIKVSKTPLQLQIKSFVKSLVIVGAIAFLIVWGINWSISKSILSGLLQGLTLAMSILPEEIPVAFSTFMALGAYQLHKQKVIAMSPHTVETLGAATVICTDKTGTITENTMKLSAIYHFKRQEVSDYTVVKLAASEVLDYAMWASETEPFDPMEKTIHQSYAEVCEHDKRSEFEMVHEYPLGGKPPMMTHVYQNKNKEGLIAVKGSVEAIVAHSNITEEEKSGIFQQSKTFSSKGYRVLGVGRSNLNTEELPLNQEEFNFEFLGLIAFYDPPKENIKEILNRFYNAGIEVKMITGDHPETALAIAQQIELKNSSRFLTGQEVSEMDESTLCEKVKETNIFARMFPEAKLKIIDALKANGEVVAMTGDGVNDGPALKAAHIGIAMGLRGSEIAKKSASLILLDDDLVHMPEAVAMGRRIYENLKKAIQYIISIHIPIILVVTLPLVLVWKYTSIFSPVHVIFLELIMGPICSIVFEKEPIEKNSMLKPPRQLSVTFFSISELFISILQGLVITLVCLSVGYLSMHRGDSIEEVRTIIFTTLIFSNVFLTLVNRSFVFSIFESLKNKNNLLPVFLGISLLVLFLSIYKPFMRNLFEFAVIPLSTLFICLLYAFIGVIWIEVYKYFIRKKLRSSKRL